MNIYCFSTLSFAKLQFKSVINKAFHKHGVASFTDAWIETHSRYGWSRRRWSHLLQMRGLKLFRKIITTLLSVASFTDAWIETRLVVNVWFVAAVASFTDAWIETMRRHYIDVLRGSHLLQMRGLKHSFRENVKKDRSRIFYRCVDWNK